MTSENARIPAAGEAESTSENRKAASRAGERASNTTLSEDFAGILAAYKAALALTPLSAETRRTYVSKVRQFLAWLAGADVEGVFSC
jgi:integrase/recombinase XerC